MKEESEKVGLKLNIQKTKIVASGPITSWEIDGETVETVSDLLYPLQPKKEKLYIVSKNKTKSGLWLRSLTPCCQIQT